MKTITFLLITSLFFSDAFTQPGTLDETFGNNGKTLIQTSVTRINYASALQRNGKIVSAGTDLQLVGGGFLLTRYLSNGNVDTSFGTNGQVVTDFNHKFQEIFAIAIQTDNKIVAAGHYFDKNFDDGEGNEITDWNILIARYLPDGTLDAAFGESGKIEVDFDKIEEAFALVLQDDGKILVGGYSANPFGQPLELFKDFLILRYMPDGKTDASFGDEGKVVTGLNNSQDEVVNALALQNDGRIVAGGRSGRDGNDVSPKFALARYLPDGSMDASFGHNGMVITDYGPNAEEIHDILLQKDGKIIAAGVANRFFTNGNMALVRYNEDGSTDANFGSAGKVTIKFNNYSEGKSVLLQSNSKIIITGNAYTSFHATSDFALARCLPDGKLDSSFGINGKVVTDLQLYDDANSSVLQPDGKIVLTGLSSFDESPNYFSLVRYIGDKTENALITKIKSWLSSEGLAWYSTNNSSVNYYSIQSSSNGTIFTEQKRVSAKAASHQPTANSQQQVYNYAVSNAQPSTYYRIAAVNKNGSTVYSDVVYYNGNNSLVKVYPNPVKDVLHVEGLSAGNKTTLTIINSQGNVLRKVIANGTSYELNVSTLKQGTYYLQVTQKEKTQSFQFIKQ